ncbi:hypothetical protein FH972_021580 [Carpinus fangiana]|uniref:Uncharacterized protein n=1 Tax=Carpinus fangiana TaxID=176857 RepID=A0A5N6KQB0_9ROSI|nr:hypothetical protein FH972_021580 [Carpinus fangiana]
MSDELLEISRKDLSTRLLEDLKEPLRAIEEARFHDVLSWPKLRTIVGKDVQVSGPTQDLGIDWIKAVSQDIAIFLSEAVDDGQDPHFRHQYLFLAAYAALQAFQQSNVTGPPLPFDSAKVLFPDQIFQSPRAIQQVKRAIIDSLGADDIDPYSIAPNIELLWLAHVILDNVSMYSCVWATRWARMRKDFMRQRILPKQSSSVRVAVYEQMALVESRIRETQVFSPLFLQEQANIHIYHGQDENASKALKDAAQLTKFEFELSGALGKRTKFQQQDLSQLVVFAKSHDPFATADSEAISDHNKPQNLELKDDTLLESISFAKKVSTTEADTKDADKLPTSLLGLDPDNQPLLQPIDSITLLLYASSITNTSPSDGITREETLPYATRVIADGSSNWQIYSQALLVRSRIEGYSSRTIERGLFQLQVLVDQIIADTTTSSEAQDNSSINVIPSESTTTTFLPRPSASQSADPAKRLRYIYQLCSPTRWELEAELAARWVSVGGLSSASVIYERLEMWAEVALCWAASEHEGKARALVRKQLFHSTAGPDNDDRAGADEGEQWQGPTRSPPPPDAARLYCILGDFDGDAKMYETAWFVSNKRYARAQRSLGKLAFDAGDFPAAAAAYRLAVDQDPLSEPSWFRLGCVLLALHEFESAAAAFTRTVQLNSENADAWGNLGCALLNWDPSANEVAAGDKGEAALHAAAILDDEDFSPDEPEGKQPAIPLQRKKQALEALKKATNLDRNSYKYWDKLLDIAASIGPPAYADVVNAQKRIIEIRGQKDGEAAVNPRILEYLVRYAILLSEDPETGRSTYDPSKPGLQRIIVEMVDKDVVPLITASPRLWGCVAKLALWRQRPGSALEAHEKAWRAVMAQPGWEATTEERWNAVVEATVELVDAYESLGQMEKTEGLAAGSGELVAKDWRFKARSAARSTMGKGKEVWEDSEGWGRLVDALDGLKTG